MWGKGKPLLTAVIIMAFVHRVSFEFCFFLVSKTPPTPAAPPNFLSPSLSLSLSFSFSILILNSFFSQATAAEKYAQLVEKAPRALVPTYTGCRNKAFTKFILSGLLEQELNKSADFQEAWTTSKGCLKVIPGKPKEHATALMVFQEEHEPFFTNFKEAVKKLSANTITYKEQFQFKSFYFLLMDLMTKVTPKQCRTVFMPTENTVKNGSSVRFESFVEAENDPSKIQDPNGEIILNITSCFYVETKVCNNKDSLILSPAEVFFVEDVKALRDEDDGDYTMIVLNHQSVETSQDCSMFSR